MTNPIKNDNFSTRLAPNHRLADDKTAQRQAQPAAGETRSTGGPELQRARELLAQRAAEPGDSRIDSAATARERVARLKQQLADDPAAAMRAQGLVNAQLFEAATARPSV